MQFFHHCLQEMETTLFSHHCLQDSTKCVFHHCSLFFRLKRPFSAGELRHSSKPLQTLRLWPAVCAPAAQGPSHWLSPGPQTLAILYIYISICIMHKHKVDRKLVLSYGMWGFHKKWSNLGSFPDQIIKLGGPSWSSFSFERPIIQGCLSSLSMPFRNPQCLGW